MICYAIKDLNTSLYFNRTNKSFDVLKPATSFYRTEKLAQKELERKIKVAETTAYQKETGLQPGYSDYSYNDIYNRVDNNKSSYNLKVVEIEIKEKEE